MEVVLEHLLLKSTWQVKKLKLAMWREREVTAPSHCPGSWRVSGATLDILSPATIWQQAHEALKWEQ